MQFRINTNITASAEDEFFGRILVKPACHLQLFLMLIGRKNPGL